MDGFFLSGVAKGMKTADEIALKEREQETKAAAVEGAFRKAVSGEVDKSIAGTVSVAGSVIDEARKAGASPEKIRGLVAPLMQDIEALSRRVGRDPTPIARQLDAMIQVPTGQQTPMTEIGKLKADLDRGFISQSEYQSRVSNLTRDLSEPNVIEGIRRKLANGESLNEGEARVYDDALKADPIARLLAGALGGKVAAPAATPALPSAPSPKSPQVFKSAEEVNAALKAGSLKIGDVVTVNGQRMRVAP